MFKRLNQHKIYILILLVSIPAILPFFRSGFYHFSDETHFANLYQMIRAIESGQIPPRWAPDMSYGYGYPLFNFYYPFPFYIAALFFYFSKTLVLSLKLAFLVTIPLSAIFMYAWLRKYSGKLVSIIGSIVYIYTPYRAVDLYVRGAIGELFAFVFFPLVSLLCLKVVKSENYKYVSLLGLATGAFVLSHNLAPLFFLPWIGIYLLIICYLDKNFLGLIRAGIGLLLGLGISTYFWLPALIEKSLVVSETPFNYLDHFPFIKQLLIPTWGYGASVWGPTDEISFQVGVANILLIIITGLIVLTKKLHRKKKIIAIYFLVSTFVLIFLMNIRSKFLWEISGFANYIQFPWRLLLLVSFTTSCLVIFINPKNIFEKLVLILLIGTSFVNSYLYFKPSEYFSPDDNYYLKRFFSDRSVSGKSSESLEYKNYSEDYLLLPNWVKKRPDNLPDTKFYSDTVNIKSIRENSSINYSADVSGEGVLEFNSYYFPGWYAKSDGKPITIKPLEPYGNIGIDISDKTSNINIYWQETPLRKTADIISLISLTVSCIFLIKKRFKFLK